MAELTNREALEYRLLTATIDTEPMVKGIRAQAALISATDKIHQTLLDQFSRTGSSIYDQMLLLHQAHMQGNEGDILSTAQSNYILENLPEVENLAGVIRSEEALPLHAYLSGRLMRCASFLYVPELMASLSQAAESLFPKDSYNPKVTQETLYYYLSAFQLALLFIHPFIEANGRVSEDAMHTLLRRRPDLSSCTRFVSPTGARKGARVNERTFYIEHAAYIFIRDIATNDFNIENARKQIRAPYAYSDLSTLLERHQGLTLQLANSQYDQFFYIKLKRFITMIGDFDYLRENSQIGMLAMNLESASKTYTPGASVFD